LINNSDSSLKNSYDEVFRKSQISKGFDKKLLQGSLALFDYDDQFGSFTPKYLEVNALLGGIEFSRALQEYVIELQTKINAIIQTDLKYWVLPQNLGVEYLVTKWPEEKLISNEIERSFLEEIDLLGLESYSLQIKGFQVNPDGCIVLRGYDSGHIFKVRDKLKSKFDWLPKRQSGWAHIPIGRILCDLNEQAYAELISECEISFSKFLFEEPINEIHYVHERQWYMETKSKIATIHLLD
jgi:hypothetical protein